MMNQRQQVSGDIGYYDLGEWWFSVFSEEERSYIESCFEPMGTSSSSNPLTKGSVLGSSGSAAQLLWGLSTWFKKVTDFQIAKTILQKAEETASNCIDKHFTYQRMIQVHYRVRDVHEDAFDKAISYCKKQIEIAPQVAREMGKNFPGNELPSHVGYKQLAIIHEKQKCFEDAIKICKQAHSQGWTGDWEKRIDRNEIKLAK